MDFSEALNKMKEGEYLQRSGWNSKVMEIFLVMDSHFGMMDEDDWGTRMEPFICMYTADKKYIPWLASQTDLLAEDWQVVE